MGFSPDDARDLKCDCGFGIHTSSPPSVENMKASCDLPPNGVKHRHKDLLPDHDVVLHLTSKQRSQDISPADGCVVFSHLSQSEIASGEHLLFSETETLPEVPNLVAAGQGSLDKLPETFCQVLWCVSPNISLRYTLCASTTPRPFGTTDVVVKTLCALERGDC